MNLQRALLWAGGIGLALYALGRIVRAQSVLPGVPSSPATWLPPAAQPAPAMPDSGSVANYQTPEFEMSAGTMQPRGMSLSAEGAAFIKGQEGFSGTAYRDARGYSIGYGFFGASPGQTMTRAQADLMFPSRVAPAVTAVRLFVTVELTQSQFDALTDFAYNVGSTAFRGSTLLRLLNEGDYAGASAQFHEWVYSNGQQIAALESRRTAEQQLFEG